MCFMDGVGGFEDAHAMSASQPATNALPAPSQIISNSLYVLCI